MKLQRWVSDMIVAIVIAASAVYVVNLLVRLWG
jgi:hypothetical protein